MPRIIVTGGSGKLGRATVQELASHGYDVVSCDLTPSERLSVPQVKVDFENLNATMEALAGKDWNHTRKIDGVVHLAAVPMPGLIPSGDIFRINTISTFNVFEACRRLGIKDVVFASSETLLGIPYETKPPYFPVDEEYAPRPETAYSLSKDLGEEMARQFCRWDPQLKIICLRFSNVMEEWEYADFPSFENDPGCRRFNLWSYIDARDGAQAIRRSFEQKARGMDVFVIANADGVMTRTPNAALIERYYPGVPMKRPVSDTETLLSIDKAKRVLGYEPQFSWRGAAARLALAAKA